MLLRTPHPAVFRRLTAAPRARQADRLRGPVLLLRDPFAEPVFPAPGEVEAIFREAQQLGRRAS